MEQVNFVCTQISKGTVYCISILALLTACSFKFSFLKEEQNGITTGIIQKRKKGIEIFHLVIGGRCLRFCDGDGTHLKPGLQYSAKSYNYLESRNRLDKCKLIWQLTMALRETEKKLHNNGENMQYNVSDWRCISYLHLTSLFHPAFHPVSGLDPERFEKGWRLLKVDPNFENFSCKNK